MADGPRWLRVVLRSERVVGGPLSRAANSPQAADALLLLARAGRLAEGVTARSRASILHALAMPSHRDVQLLEAKVERVLRELEELSVEVRDRKGNRQ